MLQHLYTVDEIKELRKLLRIPVELVANACGTTRPTIYRLFNDERAEAFDRKARIILTYFLNDYIKSNYNIDPTYAPFIYLKSAISKLDTKDRHSIATETSKLMKY